MAGRVSAIEVDRRIDTLARMICNSASTSQLIRFCSVEWGICSRQAQKYVKRAREIVREDYSLERAEFLASRLGVLDSITQKAIKSNQLSAAVGSVRLAAELTQLLNK